MKKRKLAKGNRVRISKYSKYYGDPYSNPSDVTGTIERIDEDESHCYRVKWDNGETNSYREGDLYIYECDSPFPWAADMKKQDELTVSKEFLLEAYKAACSDWKRRLEEQFPKVFETDKYPTLFKLKRGDTLSHTGLYVEIINSKGDKDYVQLNGIEIVDGVADGNILPQQARYKALYIRPEVLGFGEYEIKHKATNNGRSGSHVVYFEKKK